MEPGFPTPAASRLTGVNVKTLENWAQRGFLTPTFAAFPGTGSRRVYSFRDLIAIRVAAHMRERGIDVRYMHEVVNYLRKRKGLDLTASDILASTILVTDGHDIYEIDAGARVSALRHPDQTVLMVPLGRLVAKIKADAEHMRAA
jgi:DNA-binding transcriptional MerR regulator